MNIISLGAGVQSSTMALMAKHGEITPMPDCAIFADTQAEPANVYDWLYYLEKQLPFPIYRVNAGSLEEASLRVITGKSGKKYTKHNIPAFTLQEAIEDVPIYSGKVFIDEDGEEDQEIIGYKKEKVLRKGMIQRQCTLNFKIVPIKRKIRELVGKRGTAVQWIGISYDEIVRMKPSPVKYITNIWPLIDKKMTRQSCLAWMKSHGYPTPPRSACYFCPFHNDHEWRGLSAEYRARSVSYEVKLQAALGQVKEIKSTPYLHASRRPISQFFARPIENDLFNNFNNECEGYCGV